VWFVLTEEEEAMAGGGGNDSKGIYDVNMTPLIDVSLVLVVILLVATPMALQSSITLQKSGASTQAVPASVQQRVAISIESEDEVLVNGEPVKRSELQSHLQPLLAAGTTGPVVILCAPDVTHGTFVEVLDEAKQSGAGEIAVVGRPHAPR
jgi:biopolymer transport protein ExbD